MDAAIAQTIIGAAIGAIVTLIATFVSQHLSKKQNLEQKYDEKLEEIQHLYIEVKKHIEEELYAWWVEMEHGGGNQPSRVYVYPIDKLIMLTERYEPSLSKDIEQVRWIIERLRGNDDPDTWLSAEEYYHQYIKEIDFPKTEENLAIKFKEINQKYYHQRSSKKPLPSKRITAHSDNYDQIQLPAIAEKEDFDFTW
ncbi:MAG TPA: hypothetical protein VNG51_29215 [Ktedonobacteraceae bacterium]|nr:hypothetical protein [Ktedonobacteraceae bacterium]